MTEFDGALADVGISEEAALVVSAYFRRATEAQRAYGRRDAVVPEDLPFNHA